MKKLIACLLTLAMLVGVVPAVLAIDNMVTSAEPKSMKVLTIGDKFTRSGMEYLYKILDAEGYTDICLANTYQDGIALSAYAAGITASTPATYRFNRNNRGYWDNAAGIDLKTALTYDEWDRIILQTSVDSAEDAAALTDAVNTLIPYIKKLNSTAKIGLHVNWAAAGSTASYEKIVAAAQKTILDSGKIDFALPVGTAIMNAQTSFMGNLYKDFKTWQTDANGNRVGALADNANLNSLGELVAGYAWYSMLYGKKLTELKFEDALMVKLSSAERKVILEAVNNAVDKPFAITKSAYPTAPAQYTAVVVNDQTAEYMAGDTVTISAVAETTGQRKFQKWVATKGNVTFANANALTTTFKMPAEDVEVKAVYEDGGDVVFRAGFGRADVTPDKPINLAGNFDTDVRMSTGTHPKYPEDRINISAIALSDGDCTHIVMTMDFIRVPTVWHKKAEAAIYEKYGRQYGLDEFCLSASATHTHNSVDIGEGEVGVKQSDKQVQSVEGGKNYWYFRDFWLPGVLESVGKALEDLAPVSETRIGSADLPGLSYVRHWRYSTGVVSGVNFGDSGGANKGFFRDADQEMQLVQFVRDNADDIILMNYQGHPTQGMSGPYDNSEKITVKGTERNKSYLYLSADYPGFAYRYIQDNFKDDEGRSVSASFFQGAAGNLQGQCNMIGVREKYGIDKPENNKWGITGNPTPDTFGKQLGDYAVTTLENMKTVATGEVKVMRQQFIAPEYLWDKTREIQQDVITVGPSIAFVTAGYEMFDTHGMYIKENSPYEITFIIENSQGHEYMPNWQTWQYPILGGNVAYEANYDRGCVNVAPGTGDDLADGLVAMLNILYKSEG